MVVAHATAHAGDSFAGLDALLRYAAAHEDDAPADTRFSEERLDRIRKAMGEAAGYKPPTSTP